MDDALAHLASFVEDRPYFALNRELDRPAFDNEGPESHRSLPRRRGTIRAGTLTRARADLANIPTARAAAETSPIWESRSMNACCRIAAQPSWRPRTSGTGVKAR